MSHTSVEILCATTHFSALSFFVPHEQPQRVRGLGKHYNLRVYPKLGNVKCTIRQIPCDCIACTTMLDKPWAYGIDPTKHPRYQPVVECIYWTVLGSFNNWNIFPFSNKITSSEDFDTVHNVFLDNISDNMAILLQLRKYGDINVPHPTKKGYYVIKYLYETYTIQEDQTKYGQVIKAGELVVKSEYFSIMK